MKAPPTCRPSEASSSFRCASPSHMVQLTAELGLVPAVEPAKAPTGVTSPWPNQIVLTPVAPEVKALALRYTLGETSHESFPHQSFESWSSGPEAMFPLVTARIQLRESSRP